MRQHQRVSALLVALTTAVPVLGADTNTGLVAHWTGEMQNDARLVDATGNHPGVIHGASSANDGPAGQSLLFSDDEDDFVDVGSGLQLSETNQATWAAVVRARSFRAPDAKNRANSRNGIFGSDDARIIVSLTDRGRLTFVWDAGDRKYQSIITDREDAIPAGQWCHVAATRNGPTMVLYVNGKARQVEREAASGNFLPMNRCCIGRVNGTSKRDFDGWIADVRVYNRALEAEEIGQLAAACRLDGVAARPPFGHNGLERVPYNHAGLVVDLGVGLWAQPLPMDYDRDGDMDLVVSCADVPYNGLYWFENPGGGAMPVFKPAVRIGRGLSNIQVSFVDGRPRVLMPGAECESFPTCGTGNRRALPLPSNVHPNRVRANQWKYVDFDADGRLDVVIGVGDWTDYGWDNAFDAKGAWTRGPLHGYVYLARNLGTSDAPKYAKPVKITAGGSIVDVFGMPSPNFADFDGDGDLDLMCGEFVDSFTYFENVGTRPKPVYRSGRKLSVNGKPLRVDLCMHVDVACDWDGDGDQDLVVGQEDGRVMWFENTGRVLDGMPQFADPKFFRQQAEALKFGALVTPVSVDWDNDGDEDLICGNTAGRIGFIENLDGGCPPKWAAPKPLSANGQVIRIEAGYNGSIQGPCEAKWGYTTLSAADWDRDGLVDLVVNSIWGKVVWYRNVGTRGAPQLAAARPVTVQWNGKPPKPGWNWWTPHGNQLATQWRTTPVALDFNKDGLCDLIMLDHEGYLAFFERRQLGTDLQLLPPRRTFVDGRGNLLRLNAGQAGKSGRRKLCFADWNRDGHVDLLTNSRNVNFVQGRGTRDKLQVFEDTGQIDTRRLAGHTTSPTTVDWDHNGIPDLLVGAEDGHLYYLRNPHAGGSD